MFKNIVIPIDLVDKQSLQIILPAALNFVKSFNAKLHFIHVIPDFGLKMVEDFLPKYWVKTQEEKCFSQIKELVEQYLPDGVEASFYVCRGAVYDKIINYANEINASLIIVSAVRAQLRNYMLGPNASKIVRHADISVLVIR